MDSRRAEIEEATATRVYSVGGPISETSDPAYLEGLRNALGVAIDYAFAVIERGEEHAPPVPPALLVQARMAARNGVSLDTMLRRYFAGYSLLSEFVIEEAEDGGLMGSRALQRILRGQAAVLDRLISALSEEHARESNGRSSSAEQRLAERIERLLDGELLDTRKFSYDFEANHIGFVAQGEGAERQAHKLASRLNCRLLLVRREKGSVWAWLGSREETDAAEAERFAYADIPAQVSIALGEPTHGLAGWRLSHRQAVAAFTLAKCGSNRIVRYADVALLASILQDDLLTVSLRELYLAPLECERDGGAALRETLRAWFAADRNVSSAAAAVGVSRRTVANRLHVIEQLIGRPLREVAAQVEAALSLQALEAASGVTSGGRSA